MPTTISRRTFISLAAAGLAASTTIAQGTRTGKTYAYVGSWTQGSFGSGGGGGITVFEVNEDASLTFKSKLGPEFEDMNAGYLAVSADGRYLYSTEEVGDLHGEPGAGGGVFSFSIDPENGSLTFLNAQPSMGVNPAYIVIDHSGKYLLAANHASYAVATQVVMQNGNPRIQNVYDDATVTVLPIHTDGSLRAPSDVAILDRTGGVPGLAAQRSPHAHSISFDLSLIHI